MEELLGISPATTAALIAGAATVGMFWQRAKEILSYLSSFILQSTQLDSRTSAPLRRFIKSDRRFRRMPGGQPMYQTIFSDIEGRPAQDRRVPLRHLLLSHNVILDVRRLCPLLVTIRGERIHITGLRWLFNPDKLISDALDWAAYVDGIGEAHSRFAIRVLVGEEKGAWVGQRKKGQGLDSAETAVRDVEDSELFLDADLDTSFKYARNLWANSKQIDPFEHLFYPESIMRHVQDMHTWKRKGDWYQERGIPWRRGILFHGPAGTGKSSLAAALARSLGVPLYVFKLGTMSDQEFMRYWEEMNGPCVALFEDIDTVFQGRTNVTNHQALSFECLLNCISGVSTMSGIALVVTTNHLEHVDEALKFRPGRIDVVVEVPVMEAPERTKLATRTLRDWPELVPQAVIDGEGMAAVQFSEHCVQLAFQRMAALEHDREAA